MERDSLIAEAVIRARRELEWRAADKDQLQMPDLIDLAVQRGALHDLTFQEIEDALDKPLSELVSF